MNAAAFRSAARWVRTPAAVRKRSDARRQRIGEAYEIEAQRTQASARVLVVGLAVGARFLLAAEIEPAATRKRFGLNELQEGCAALLHRADRLDAAQANHGRVHVGC